LVFIPFEIGFPFHFKQVDSNEADLKQGSSFTFNALILFLTFVCIMAPYTSLATSLIVGLLTVGADAAFKPPINNTLEPGVETECKTCPYSLCTNKAFYEYDTPVTLVCWTRGTVIDGDALVKHI